MRRHVPVVAHCTDSEDFPNLTLAPYSQKCLTYVMLEESPVFHLAAVQSAERVWLQWTTNQSPA